MVVASTSIPAMRATLPAIRTAMSAKKVVIASTSPSMRSMSSPGLWRPCQAGSRRSAWAASRSRSRLPARHDTRADHQTTTRSSRAAPSAAAT